MGFLGKIGAGMGEYGKILGEKRVSDQEAQKDKLAYQRQVALEGLRAKNTQTLEGQRQTYQTGESIRAEGVAATQAGVEAGYEESLARTKGKLRQEDITFAATHQKGMETEKAKAKFKIKQDQWQNFIDEGMTDNMTENEMLEAKASFIFGYKATKGKTPTDKMYEIASEMAQASAPEGTDPRELGRLTSVIAYGMVNNPKAVKAKMGTLDTSKDTPGKFNESVDLPKLKTTASRASQGNKGAQKQLTEMLTDLKGSVSKYKYEKILKDIKAEDPQQGVMDTVIDSPASTSMRGPLTDTREPLPLSQSFIASLERRDR